MLPTVPRALAGGLILAAAMFLAPPAHADAGDAPPIRIVYLRKAHGEFQPLSLLQTVPSDEGVAGATVALSEINLNASFLPAPRRYALDIHAVPEDQPPAAVAAPLLDPSGTVIVADLGAADLLAVADLPAAKSAVILDIGTSDDRLRGEDCRANVFHLAPSRAMLADALAQFLAWKQWPRWYVLRGESGGDAEFAADIRRSAKRFGGRIVGESVYGYSSGARRVDTGYQQVQTQMPAATRETPDHDVLVVADEADEFGDYLPYNTYQPKLVVGTQGLVPSAWTPAFQEYSALQMQHRFGESAHRAMTERDYEGWLAVRMIGEVALRSGNTEPAAMGTFLRSEKFNIAAFKGQPLSFRPWDQQLRQPILLATPLIVVSMSPQEGFLHPRFLTDTLGFDAPETKCHLAQ